MADQPPTTAFMLRLRAQLARQLIHQLESDLLQPDRLLIRAMRVSTSPERLLGAEIAATAMLPFALSDAPWACN